MKTWRAIALCVAVASGNTVAGAAESMPLRVAVEQPRAFGWHIGDTFERRITVEVPRRLTLDETSLPKVGRPGGVAELRAIERSRERIDGGERLRFVLRYQLFVSPEAVRTFELRGFRLRFVGAPNDETALVDAWPLSVAPLTPPEFSTREGLGQLRPDAELRLPAVATGRLAVWSVIAAALLGYLAHVYLGERWWARRHRPFANAYRDLARLDLERGGDAVVTAFLRMHRAFDESAGRAMFAAGAGTFAADGSRWAPLRADIAEFFERSRAAFFDGATPSAVDGPRLLALARALRDAERGAA